MNVLVLLNFNDSDRTADTARWYASCATVGKVVVVDNCSTDGSFEHLSDLLADGIDVISSGRNGGYAFGNNFGFRYAREQYGKELQYLIVANPDTWASDGSISRIVRYLDHNPTCGLASGKILDPNDGTLQTRPWKMPTFWSLTLKNFLVLSKVFNFGRYRESLFLGSGDVAVDVLPGCFFVARNDVMSSVADFDEDTFLYGEETLLARRIRSVGVGLAVVRDSTIVHLHSRSISKSITSEAARLRLMADGDVVYLRKYLHCGLGRIAIFRCANVVGIFERLLWSKVRQLLA